MVSFWIMATGLFVWTLGCYVSCAVLATSPIGALVCRRLASKRGLAGGRYAWTGGWYWIAGFAPWVYCLYQINGRPPPIRMYNLAFRWLLVAWLVGPVIGGGMMAAGPGIGPNSGWLFAVPVVNLVGIVVSVIWRSVSTGTVTGDGQLRSGDVMPFFFAMVGMLTLLLQGFLVPLILSLL